MGVNVHAARHYDHSPGVQRGSAAGQVGHDVTVLDADITDLTVDSVGRVVHCAPEYTKPGAHVFSPGSLVRTAWMSWCRVSTAVR